MKALRVNFLNYKGKPAGAGIVYDIGGGRCVTLIKTEILKDGKKKHTLQFGRFVGREYINEGA